MNSQGDSLATAMRSGALYLLAIVIGLVPIFFIPLSFAPFGYSKTLFVAVGAFLALIFYSLAVLRTGTLSLGAPAALFAMWGVVGVNVLSALFSGDLKDALIGESFDTQTTAFLALMALVATLMSVYSEAKAGVMRLYLVLAGSTVVLGLYHFLRIVFGPEFLSFGVFTSAVASPIGGWNDLGLFFGLSILLSMVALEQLPLPRLGRAVFAAVIVVALGMLAIINFFAIWIVLGLTSLVLLMYSLTKDRFSTLAQASFNPGEAAPREGTGVALAMTTLTFIIALLFVIGGSFFGGLISKWSGISYVEVRPSLEATIDIARGVYGENAALGIGPNKFADAWRLYKNPGINQTVFWNTEFRAGSGFLTTQLVTTGVVGALAWVSFLALFVYAGLTMLFRATQPDRFWYFIGTSSFVASCFLWGMSLIYVPGTAVLLLAAATTGITFAAYRALVPTRLRLLTLAPDRRAGFALIAAVMVVIIGSVSALYYTGRHYVALYTFNDALGSIAEGTSLDTTEVRIAEAFTLAQDDAFARQIALYQLARMNALLAIAEPSEAEQQQFQTAVANGVRAGQVAVDADPSDARNWATMGGIYSMLTAARIEGALERGQSAMAEARRLDPRNPEYALIDAQLASRGGDTAAARTKANEAVALKPNYTDALFFLSQLSVVEGDTEGAIAATRSIIALEPNNPGRYYQLGVLYSAAGDTARAIDAFERAVALDGSYANARYFLALAYAEDGRSDAAIRELETVRDLNPSNTTVQPLIDELRATGALASLEAPTDLVAEPAPESVDEVTTSTEAPDTDLLTPVNTPIETDAASAADEAPSSDEAPASAEAAPAAE